MIDSKREARILVLTELLLVCAIAAATAWGVGQAIDGALADAATRSGAWVRTVEQAVSEAHRGLFAYLGGVAAIAFARAMSARRDRPTRIGAWGLVPALVAAVSVGLVVQMGYGDPLRGPGWPGPTFGHGCGLGLGLAAIVTLLPWDPGRVAERTQGFLVAGIGLVFALLWAFGSGPEGSGTRINLGPMQPLELVKVGMVAFMAAYLGRRSPQLRWQRSVLGLPRVALLVPAVAAAVLLFGGLVVVRDLGPILILGVVFAVLLYLATRSAALLVLLGTAAVLGVAIVAADPEALGLDALSVRLGMWLQPWLNGLPGGDQLAGARWAVAAGGLFGQGLGEGMVGALPAGHTDLVVAHLAEELGFFGVAAHTACVATIAGIGLKVAARNRTGTRMLLAAGLSSLIVVQWLVIVGGTTGALPLTGVVVPFLSAGRSSMLVLCGVVGILLRLAEDGAARHTSDVHLELGATVTQARWAAAGVFAAGMGILLVQGTLLAPSTSARGAVTTLADGTVRLQYDRRMRAVLDAIPRGHILDRHGAVLAGTDEAGDRTWPLGDDLGTLLGPVDGGVLRAPWSIERRYEARLRGVPELDDGVATWMGRRPGEPEVLLFAVRSRQERPEDRARALHLADERLGEGAVVRLLPQPAPDLARIVPLLHDDEALAVKAAQIDARSVRLTLDGRLQAATASALRAAADKGQAAAAVVIDVDSGEVLARAQVPDYDPGDPEALALRRREDAQFMGVFGAWPDRAGERGVFQAGSIAKLVTALAAGREGLLQVTGEGCDLTGETVFSCVDRDARGPVFMGDGWRRGIHDHPKDPTHGSVDLVEGLAVSCNVYFAQLGLELGPEPMSSLVAEGLDLGWGGPLEPGRAGSRHLASTAFGQGAAAMSVDQAARMTAAIGGGGVLKRCPILRDESCEEVRIGAANDMQVILAGMRGAVERGTARNLDAIEGVVVYGKTGTADAIGLVEEQPYGVTPGATDERPHAWFVALGEPESPGPQCGVHTPGRIAVAVVVPRSGSGRYAAAPAAVEILGAARELGYMAPPPQVGALVGDPGVGDG